MTEPHTVGDGPQAPTDGLGGVPTVGGQPVPGAPPLPTVRRGPPRKSALRNALEWVLVIVGAVVVALLIKTYLVQAFRIPSESMVPTLQAGDRVLVNKLSYRTGDVGRGDVVVFRRPDALPGAAGQPEDLIKRVIGLPGDTVVAREGVVYVNDRPLQEPYLAPRTATSNLDTPVVVPDGEVLVLGDNRANSQDGRVFGPVPIDSIIGRAFLVMWPPGRISTL